MNVWYQVELGRLSGWELFEECNDLASAWTCASDFLPDVRVMEVVDDDGHLTWTEMALSE